MKRKRIILIASLCAVLVVALTLALLGKFVFGWFDSKEEPYVPPVLEDGEAYYYFAGGMIRDVVLMFPQLSRSDIGLVRVHNAKGENYFFYHEQEGSSNYFLLGNSKDDKFEDSDIYYPPIIGEWGGTFDYTTLYDDSTTLPTMLAAVGAVRIGERLRPEDGNFSEEWLSHYGLAKADDPAYFEIVPYLRDANGNYIYTDGNDGVRIGRDPGDGKYYLLSKAADGTYTRGEAYTGDTSRLTPVQDAAGIRRVYVGSRTVDDTGYYLRLEGRNTVYTTTTSNISEVVNRDVGYYVAPRAVTKSESNYAYQISPNVSVYRGKYSRDPETVITALMSLGLNIPEMWASGRGDGTTLRDVFLQADLREEDYAVFLEAFLGAKIGEGRDILTRGNRLIEPGSTVRYRITEIRGYYDASTHAYHAAADIGATRAVAAGDKMVVTYRLGDGATEYVGLLDLGQANLPPAFAGTLVGQPFGTVSGAPLTVEITYDGSTSYDTEEVTIGLVEISAITDRATGEAAATAGAGCDVTLRFYQRRGENYLGESLSVTLRLPDAGDLADDAKWFELNGEGQSITILRTLGTLVTGKGVATFASGDAPEADMTYPVEYLADFTLYLGANAHYVNQYEEVVTFGHTNRANVFFGSTRYTIKSPVNRTPYGLDADMALAVLREFEDMTGDETVALGLDDAAIEKWGLYAYRVYYEMPFDCYTTTRADETVDYHYKRTVGYELLISEKQADGSRYVGSTQFDTVIKFKDGGIFDFAEWTFEERWAQSNLLLVSYEDLRSLVIDLNFSDGGDYSHVWAFDTAVDRAYRYETRYIENGVEKVSYTTGSRLFAALVDGGAHSDGLTSRELRNILRYRTGADTASHTEAGKLVLPNGYYEALTNEFRALDAIYGNRTDAKEPQYYDGATYFQTLLQIMNTTYYFGNVGDELTEGEIADLMADPKANVMTFAFTMRDADNKKTYYTIRFYTYSQHTLVRLTTENEQGDTLAEARDFYIQTREVRKIANAVVALTRGETIDNNRY